MATTPIIWSGPVTVNQTPGAQSSPQTIGLAGGNILVVWQDSSAGPSSGSDIVGVLLNPRGERIGSQFQINSAFSEDNEGQPKIAGLPDGGFVMVYASRDIQSDGHVLVVERFNGTGVSQFSSIITNAVVDDGDSSLAQNVAEWELTVAPNGDYTVAFNVASPGNPSKVDIHAFTFDISNGDQRSVEHLGTAQNNPDDNDCLAAIGTFSNGDIIAFYHERDEGGFPLGGIYETMEVRITRPDGTVVTNAIEFGGGRDDSAIARDMAILADGRFVCVFRQRSFDVGDVETTGYFGFKIGSRDASNNVTFGAGVQITAPLTVDGNIGTIPDASIVALPDGGFFIAWTELETNALRGTRYDSAGAVVGTAGMLIAPNIPQAGTIGELSLTTDGRILIAYQNTSGEISQVILDPREGPLFGTAAGEVIAGQPMGGFIFGEGGNDLLYGVANEDLIYGGEGHDTAYGGSDRDTLQGGPGNDLLFGESGGDNVLGEDGADTLYGGADGDNVDGGIGADGLYGDVGRDTLSGGDGNDTVYGGADGDYASGGAGNDAVYGDSGHDTLSGGEGADTLRGGSDNDTLDGGTSGDRLEGGVGDDTYILSTIHPSGGFTKFAYDTVVENEDAGRDTVLVGRVTGLGSLSGYTLAANIELGIVTGAEAFNLTGNAIANRLTGNGAANSLSGLDGDDLLRGESGADTLNGGDGADELRGAAGNDLMIGGAGNDRYFVDSVNDQVSETEAGAAGGANDIVYATISYTLGANVERLVLQGTVNLTGTGNELRNVIQGNASANLLQGLAGNDRLDGKDGADTLAGGTGNDTLTGGSNADVFRFGATNAGADRITDFQRGGDRFQLSGGSFSALTIAANGDTILTHNGGTIRVEGTNTLTLAQWNALVIPGGESAGADAAPALPYGTLQRFHDLTTASHGDWAYA